MTLNNIDFYKLHIDLTIPDSHNLSSFQDFLRNNYDKSLDHLSLNSLTFRDSILDNSLFHKSILNHCDFTNSTARYAKFYGADLTNADFTGADLTGAEFRGSDLTGAIFNEATLANASFKRCILDQAEFKNTSAKFSIMNSCSIRTSYFKNSDFRYSSFKLSDLSESSFISCWANGSKLHRIKGRNINCEDSDFEEVQFINANISYSHFKNTILLRARFNDASFENNTFTHARLSGACLAFSNLGHTVFEHSFLYNCDFNNTSLVGSSILSSIFDDSNFDSCLISKCKEITKCSFKGSNFRNIELTPLLNTTPEYVEQCSVDHKSIANTIENMKIHPLEVNPAPDLINFLENCGMPHITAMYAVDSIRSLQPNQLETLMKSTFISYGAPDEEFARKLNKDLKKKGVKTFFFPESAPFGEKIHTMMRGINKYDRIILICSKQSLNRSGLLYEIEKTLEREARNGGESFLIPVRIDDYVLNEWHPKLKYMKEEVLNRVVADFTDEDSYKQQLGRLINALKNKEVV